MQKIINGIAIASGVVSLTVVGLGGYVFIRKDAIVNSVKSRVADELNKALPGLVKSSLPAVPSVSTQTGPALPAPSNPIP